MADTTVLDRPASETEQPASSGWARMWLRVKHELRGHPKSMVAYGTAIEGASCGCGYHWGPADMQV